MSKSVWKFPVEVDDVAVLTRIPEGAQILKADLQMGGLQVWALCDPDARLVSRKIAVVGTGHVRDDLDGAVYIGTVLLVQDTLVFHIFDLGEVAE